MRKLTSSPRARVTSAGLVVGGMLAYAAIGGAAGATGAADETITVVGDAAEGRWDKASPDVPLQIETGDAVTWQFAGASHNVASTNAVTTDPRWDPYVYPGPNDFDAAQVGSSTTYTFYKAGEYTFTCNLHMGAMDGKIVVTGEDLEIPEPPEPPDPTATPTATPTTPPTGAPTVDAHTSTPPPTPDADTTKPALSGVKLRGRRRAARVTFTLSENATVTLQVRKRRAKRALRTLTVQARAGTRTVVVRSAKLRKGRYTVALVARDALGNKSATATSALRIRK